MKKSIYTHCQNLLCGKQLPFPNNSRKYCSNNNKCKNDHHNGVRNLKVNILDGLTEMISINSKFESILNGILQKRRIVIMKENYLKLMGIDLTISEIFKNTHTLRNNEYLEYKFKNFILYHFIDEDQVAICR